MALVDRVASLATRVGQELKALALSKADDSAVVHLSGTETISGTKVFGAPPQVPVGTMVYHPVRRDDVRLADSRVPVSHAASHGAGGVDAITPAGIGAAAATHTHSSADLMVAARTVAYGSALTGLAPLPGVMLDVVTCTLTGNPTITPGTSGIVDGQVVRLRLLAGSAARTVTLATAVRTGTAVTRSLDIASGQAGVVGLEYVSGLGAWVLFSAYATSS